MSLLVVKRTTQKGKRRIFFVLGRTVAKKANQRNLLKRRIRTIMQPFIKKTDQSYKIVVKPQTRKLSYQELKNEIESILQ